MICGQTCDGLYHFVFYLVNLYSEIDHIHLSSEAQCVSHLYPQVDCHTRSTILFIMECGKDESRLEWEIELYYKGNTSDSNAEIFLPLGFI